MSTLKEAVESAIRAYFYRLLSDTQGNVTKAAKRAGISRQTFYRYLKRCAISGEPGSAYGPAGRFSERPARRVGR